MIKLPTSFKSGVDGNSVNPHWFQQVKRNTVAAIYKRTIESTGAFVGYEVFQVKVLPKGTQIFKEVLADDTEKYPGTSTFGIQNAWFVVNMERANMYFDQITKEVVAKSVPEEIKPLVIPLGEFSTQEFSDANHTPYPQAFILLKEQINKGTVKFSRAERRNIRGKATNLYIKS